MLIAKDLKCSRGSRLLFRNLTFSLAPGECIFVEGNNGTGKTSLLKIIIGLLEPDEGNLYWQDKRINAKESLYQENIIYIGDNFGLKLALTPIENLNFWFKTFKKFSDKNVTGKNVTGKNVAEELLKTHHLLPWCDTPCSKLSSGMLQRLVLLKLKLLNRPLWILDEPLNNLDKNAIDWFEDELRLHSEQGGMTIFTSHMPLSMRSFSGSSLSCKTIQLGDGSK